MKINEVISPQLPKVGTKTKVGQVPYTFDGSHWINNQTKKPAAGLEQIQAWNAFSKKGKNPSVLTRVGNKILGKYGQATRNDPSKSNFQKIGGTIGSALGAAYGRRKDRKAAQNQPQGLAPAKFAQPATKPNVDYDIAPKQRNVKPTRKKPTAPPSNTWDTGLGADGTGAPPPKARGGRKKGQLSQTQNAIRKRQSRAQKKQQKEIDSLG